MRGCLLSVVWSCLAILVLGTGSCALCTALLLPLSAKMMGCTDCPVLEVGDPDAAWDRLEPDTEYVLVGCQKSEWHEAGGHQWFIIGNARQHESGDPQAVAVRVGESRRNCGAAGPCEVQIGGSECFRMLVSYEPEHRGPSGTEWLSFAVHDSTNDFDD